MTLFATTGRFQSRTPPYLELIRIEPSYPSFLRLPVRIVLFTTFVRRLSATQFAKSRDESVQSVKLLGRMRTSGVNTTKMVALKCEPVGVGGRSCWSPDLAPSCLSRVSVPPGPPASVPPET